jgi:predicted nucleic acid-binding protein
VRARHSGVARRCKLRTSNGIGLSPYALPWVDLRRPEWRRVGHVGALLRERGATVALTDIEIAVAAEAADAALWTFDSDFQRIAAVMPNLRFFAPVK